MSATAKIFKHGRSQAVRLPKAFRLPGDEVRVTKVGDRVILEPLTTSVSMPWALIDQIGDKPFMPQGREQPDMPADRPIFDR
jgi:antitoxin VapB